jgi:hypothetical protein
LVAPSWVIASISSVVNGGLPAAVAVHGPQAEFRMERHAQAARQLRALDRPGEPVFRIARAGAAEGGDPGEHLGRPVPVEQLLHLVHRGCGTAAVGQRQ